VGAKEQSGRTWSSFNLTRGTPSKSFRHYSLPRVFWELKSMSGIFKSPNGGKLFLNICKLERFESKKIPYELMEMYLLFTGTYRAVKSDRDLATLFCVQEKF
jgi:hypothetical protein